MKALAYFLFTLSIISLRLEAQLSAPDFWKTEGNGMKVSAGAHGRWRMLHKTNGLDLQALRNRCLSSVS